MTPTEYSAAYANWLQNSPKGRIESRDAFGWIMSGPEGEKPILRQFLASEWARRGYTDKQFRSWLQIMEARAKEYPEEFRPVIPPTSSDASAYTGELLSEIEIESVNWLVDGVFPLGELSIIGADGGTGKGVYTAQLIACITTGKPNQFFPTFHGEPSKVLIFSGEDDANKVIKPRLIAAGADTHLVRAIEAVKYQMKTQTRLLLGSPEFLNIARDVSPRLIIVDPLQSFLSGSVDMSARNEMREIITPYLGICKELNAAGLTVMHANKRNNAAGRMRLADSSDMWDMARSVFMMGKDKNSGLIYASHEKSSYAKPANTALFKIEDSVVENNVHTGVAVFQSYSDRKDADFISDPKQKAAGTKDEAKSVIISTLAEATLGSVESAFLKAIVASEVGCSPKTVERAFTELVHEGRIRSHKKRESNGVNKNYAFLIRPGEKEEVPKKD